MPDAETYALYAVRYAVHERVAAHNFIHPPDLHDTPMPLDYFVWAAVGAARTFVIDTGFNAAAAAKRGRTLIRCPTEGLARLGIEAAAVEDVILTHMHYDHVGNFDLFPKATFHLQDQEMVFATGRHMGPGPFAVAYEIEDVTSMVREVYGGRVRFHDGDAELAPGISLHHVGGHTMGLQVVRVRTARGWVVVASDASHLYANMEMARPYPTVFHLGDMVQGYRRVRELADTEAHIIPGHDPLVMARYPAPEPALEGIAVRLDVAPAGA